MPLTDTQRLLPNLKSGKFQVLLLAGVEAAGKSVLATELVRLLEPEGFSGVVLMATPFQPLSTGRILALFETLFLHHGLSEEWEAVCDPLTRVEDRLSVCITVMNQKLPLILLLDGLESCLDAATGHFLEPSMGTFFTDLLDQLNGLSRVIITSRSVPQRHPSVSWPLTFQQEILPVYEGPVNQTDHPTDVHSLGRHWLDVALEAVDHFLHIGAFEEALQSARPVSDYFSQRNFLWEQERLNRKLLAVGEHPRPLYLIALVLLKRHCQEEAQQLLMRVLSFGEEQFPKESALALFELAVLSLRQQPVLAKNYLLRSLAINQLSQDRSGQAVCYAHLGFLGMQQEDIYEAQTYLNSALDLCRELQDKKGMANILPWTGELFYRVGHVGQARSHFQEALTLLQNPVCAEIQARLRHRLAMIDLGEEKFSQALEGFLQTLKIHRAMKSKKGEVAVFFQLGRLAKAMGHQEASLHFLGICQCIDQEIGDPSAFQELTLFQEIATTALGLGRTAAQAVLEEMQILYGKDGGESLIEKTFHGGVIGQFERGFLLPKYRVTPQDLGH